MREVKVYHHRGHGHGGKFDGNCYVTTGVTTKTGGSAQHRVMVRFKPDLSITTSQTLFGTYAGAGIHFRLQIVYSGGNHYLQVRHESDVFTYTKLPLEEKIYNVEVWAKHSISKLELRVTESGSLMRLYQINDIAAAPSLNTYPFYVGATNYAGTPVEQFTGIIYSWYAYTYDGSTITSYKLVFISGYGGSSIGQVADFYGGTAGVIQSRPDDFWSSRTDISDRIIDCGSITRSTSKYGTPVLEKWDFTTYDLELAKDDVITIEIDSSLDYCLVITDVGDAGLGEWKYSAVHPFTLLDGVAYETLVAKMTTSTYYRTLRNFYTNYSPDAADVLIGYKSLTYYLKAFIYALELDAILSTDVSGLPTNSPYYDYEISDAVRYSKILLNNNMCEALGAESSDEEAKPASTLLSELCFSCRLMHYISGGKVIWMQVEHGSTLIANDDLASQPPLPKVTEYNTAKLTSKILKASGGDYPDVSLYASAFSSDDLSDVEAKQTFDGVINPKYTSHTIPAAFWLFRNHSGTAKTMYYVSASQTFIEQLRAVLDAEFRLSVTTRSYTLKDLVDFDEKHKKHSSDFKNLKTDIEMEV
jgi:hypothetical protein